MDTPQSHSDETYQAVNQKSVRRLPIVQTQQLPIRWNAVGHSIPIVRELNEYNTYRQRVWCSSLDDYLDCR